MSDKIERAALYDAAEKLPIGFAIDITIEAGVWSVYLCDAGGNTIDTGPEDEPLAECVERQ